MTETSWKVDIFIEAILSLEYTFQLANIQRCLLVFFTDVYADLCPCCLHAKKSKGPKLSL